MKKRMFTVLAVFSLALSACSFQDAIDWAKDKINFVSDSVTNLFGGKTEEEHEGDHHDEVPQDQSQGGGSGDNTHGQGTDPGTDPGTNPGTDPGTNPGGGEEPPVEWEKVWQTNAYEHWYVDQEGNVIKNPHHFEVVSSTEMTCTEHSHQTLRCLDCEYQKFVEGDTYAEHVYTSKLTKEATCQHDGEITFTCEKCGDSFVQTFSEPNAHKFVMKSDVEGVKTYECAHEGCNEIKTVIDFSQQTSAEVSTEQLQEAGEVQLENAAIAFDEETLEGFGENVSIAAETVTNETVTEELNLNAEEQEKLQGKPIIDFSVTTNTGEGEEKVSEFAGSVKVTIPYELAANEDPNGIAIWYLSENGTEAMQASYIGGNVSFETTHFSYYAVVHLPPEEVCASFGHEMVKGQLVNSTCAVHGYDDMICRRCNKVTRTELPLEEHNWKFVEKLDPTSTSTGYVRYECSVCHSLDERIIPMIDNNPNNGFYINLVKSILTPDFKQYSTVTEHGITHTSESYSGLDYEGMPFEYNPNGSVAYKGYRYDNYYWRYDYNDNSAQMMQMINAIIDFIPQIYKDNFEDIANWLISNYFVKTETEEGLTFSLNYETNLIAYDLLTKENLGTAIPGIIGPDVWESILAFISEHYSDTVGEFIDAIEEKGYLISELYDAAIQIAGMFGMEMTAVPSLDEILTPELKEMPLIEALESLIQMAMGGGGSGEGQPGDMPEDYPQEGEEEGKPEEGGKRSRGMIPATYEEFEATLEQYLGMNLIDIVLGIVSSLIPESAAAMITPELVEMYIDTFRGFIVDQKYDMVLKTTANGAFISFESIANDLYIPAPAEGLQPEQLESAYTIITKSFDKTAILAKCQEVVAKYEHVNSAFDLNASQYEWFAKVYEDYYGKKYPGFKLEFVRDYLNNGVDALISNKEIELALNYHYDDNGEMHFNKETGKLIIYLNNDVDDGYSRSYGITMNNTGLGTVLKPNEIALLTYSREMIRFVQLLPVNGEDEVSSAIYVSESAIPSFEFLYTIDDYRYIYSDANGSFSYFYERNQVPVLSSYEEWDAYLLSNEHWSGTLPSTETDAEKYQVIKYVDKETGEVEGFERIWKSEGGFSNIAVVPFINANMTEVALQHSQDFAISYYLYAGEIVETVQLRTPCVGYYGGKENNKFDIGYPYHYEEYNEEALEKNYSFSLSHGNVTATYSANTTSHKCTRNISWRIKVGNNIIASGSHSSHIDRFNVYRELSRIPQDSCHDLVTYESVCSECGKVYSEWTSVSEHHNYDWQHNVQHRKEPTYTQAGYSYYSVKCSDCGDVMYTYFSYLEPCRHENHEYDEETHMLTCNDCDYEVESENGEVPELIYELFSKNDETTKYSVFGPHIYYHSQYFNLDDYYIFTLAVGYKDENGDFQVVHNLNNGEISTSLLAFNDDIFYDHYGSKEYYSWCYTIEFSTELYEELLARVQAEHANASATIVATSRDSGTQFIYAI